MNATNRNPQPRRRLRLLALALAAALILQPVGCAGKGPQADPEAQAYLQGFVGTWDTTWGRMTLTVSGNKVSGTYEYRDGQMEATLSADSRTLEGWWTELPTREPPGDAGRVILTLVDNDTLDGYWWFGEDEDGGEWVGERVDPSDIEEEPEPEEEPWEEPEPGEEEPWEEPEEEEPYDEPDPEEEEPEDGPSAGSVRPPTEPGLTRSSNPDNDLLFYVTKDDLSRIYYYGTEEDGAMRLSHITLDDGDGEQSIVIYNSQLLPVQWILPTLTVAVYPTPDEEVPADEEGVWFDPSRAFHVVMGEEEKTLTVDIQPGDLAALIDDMEMLSGQGFDGARDFLAEHDVTFDELVELAAEPGPDQPLYIAAAALSLEQAGATARSVPGKPGLAAPHAVVFGQAAKVGASALGGVLAGALGDSLDPGDGPGVGVLLCRGAAKYGVCHYMFYHSNRLGDCVANCHTSLGCFTDICMPMDISADLAMSMGGAMSGR